MSCGRCHAEVPDGSRFCPACGAEAVIAVATPATRFVDVDVTRSAPPNMRAVGPEGGGWLGSSGGIDHGRFTPGTILDERYRITGMLGRGGMGEVYRADDLRLGQEVAIKLLPESLAGQPERLSRFHHEVRIARQVAHPNLCRVYDVGGSGTSLYLSMEYVDGEDLLASLRRIGRFPEDRALDLARQICAGLAAAHDRGVIHRDLKPANIMLDAAGRVRIMDFGLAAAGLVDDVRAGTPAYMAPEQINGREATARSDIYSLGLVLYEIFTGRRAFNAMTMAALREQQASGDITSPTSVVKTLDPAIERAILRCLDHDAAKRPSTALIVAASLPGGDPLAAALAAGETPSPQMVAAAGTDRATVSPLLGLILLAGTFGLVAGVAKLSERVTVIGRVPIAKPVDVLIDRATSIRRDLGYADAVADTATGFMTDTDYLAWAARRGAGATHWAQLGAGRPAVIQFWQRSSPAELLPLNILGPVTLDDPPAAYTAGSVAMALDAEGRLTGFEATPPQTDDPTPAGRVNWDVVFAAAGLDRQSFSETIPGWTPHTHSDERHAWAGLLPGTKDIRVGIEAAGYRGRPVMFEVVGPWTRAARDDHPDRTPHGSLVAEIFNVCLLAGAALLARRNLQLGRGDRPGALRFGVWIGTFHMAMWLVGPGHVNSAEQEIARMFATVAISLFIGVMMFALYLAGEPYVRRTWPKMLVTWTRVTSGRFRDPLVGRDLLIGVCLGLSTAAIQLSANVVPSFAGGPAPQLMPSDVNTLLGGRAFAAGLMQPIQDAFVFGPLLVVILAGLKRVVRRDGIAAALLVALYCAVTMAADQEPAFFWWHLGAELIVSLAVMAVFLRFGLFAAIVSLAVNGLINLPLTLDRARIYSGHAFVTMACVLAIAAVGYWLARANTSLWRD